MRFLSLHCLRNLLKEVHTHTHTHTEQLNTSTPELNIHIHTHQLNTDESLCSS